MAVVDVHDPGAPDILCPRQARLGCGAIATAERPRGYVVGAAGAGKSALLRHVHHLLQRQGRAVTLLADTDPAAVPASRTLIVDDLERLDDERMDALATRAEDPDAALVVASRPWPRSDASTRVARHLRNGSVPIVLGHVGPSDVRAFLDDRGRSISGACLDHLLAITGGLAWLTACALEAHDGRDCAENGHDAWHRAVEEQVLHRLDTLGDDHRRHLIELISVAPADSYLRARDAGDLEAAIAQGHAEGLLLRNGEPVPVVRSAILSSIPAHRLVAYRVGVDDHTFVLQQALAAWGRGDVNTAIGHVESRLRDDSAGDRGAFADLAAGVWATRGMMTAARDIYAAVPSGAEDSRIRASVARIGVGVPDLPGEGAGIEPDAAAPVPSTSLIALRELGQGLQASLTPEMSPIALTHLARASELYTVSRESAPLPELPAVVAATVAIGMGDLETAQRVIGAAVTGGQGGSWALRRLLLWQALIAIQAEKPAEARAALAQAEAIPGPCPLRDEFLHQTVLVTLARRYDDVATLEAVWAQAQACLRHVDVDLYMILPLSSLISSSARLGDSDTVAPHFTRALALLRSLGSPPAWSIQLHWAGVQQGILVNKPDRVAPHARALVAAAPKSPLADAMARAGRVWMSVLGGSVDPEAVEEAARMLASSGLAWDGARLAAHGARRSDDRRTSARLLSCARELHPRDSVREQEAASEQAVSANAPEPASKSQLSPRELDVAVLVLEGKTYAEIGEAIFISPKTVEHHVAHIRRRLGATSRSDLMAKLRVVIPSPALGAPSPSAG